MTAPKEETDRPPPDDRTRGARIGSWHRSHKRLSVLIGVVVALLLVAGGTAVLWPTTAEKATVAASENPVIAGYQEQLPALAKAVEAKPDDPEALRAYGVALYATGDVSRAKDQYEAELVVNRSDPVLLNNLGNVYRDLGTYDKALDAYQQAISKDPKSATAYVNLANLYQYTLDQKDLAIITLGEAQRNLPDNPDIGVLLGIAYEQSGQTDNARSAFDAVLAQDASNAAAQAGLTRIGP